MRCVKPDKCPECGSTDVFEFSIEWNGFIQIRCSGCGRQISDISQSSNLEADQDKLAQKWFAPLAGETAHD